MRSKRPRILHIKVQATLPITGSLRFSPVIAKLVDKVCLTPYEMSGNTSVKDIAPTIIVFNDENIVNVISKFGELIIQNELHIHERNIFKAIGQVAKEKESGKRTIKSYWSDYSKQGNQKNKDFTTLGSYLKKIENDGSSFISANIYQKQIIAALVKISRMADKKNPEGRYFTETSLRETF